jgi:tRNA threonylcarbamoyladenosine biosynthesis protein TsaE
MLAQRRIAHPEELNQAAAEWLESHPQPSIVCLYGSMGAGKTTFTAALCKALATSPATSPTFSIVNEYSSYAGPVFHFDLYRIKDVRELIDIGFEEYLNRKAWVFIEWPEVAGDILRHYSTVNITISMDGSDRVLNYDEAGR